MSHFDFTPVFAWYVLSDDPIHFIWNRMIRENPIQALYLFMLQWNVCYLGHKVYLCAFLSGPDPSKGVLGRGEEAPPPYMDPLQDSPDDGRSRPVPQPRGQNQPPRGQQLPHPSDPVVMSGLKTENLQIFPFAGFIWWFCQYLCERSTFLLWSLAAQGAAIVFIPYR